MQRRCWCSQRAGAAADARGSASRPPRRHLGDAAAPICSHTPHQRGTRAPHTPLPPPHICSVRGASCSSGGLTALLPQPPRDVRERPARRLGALLLKHGARLIQRRGRAHHRRERVLPRGPSPRRCPLKRAAVASPAVCVCMYAHNCAALLPPPQHPPPRCAITPRPETLRREGAPGAPPPRGVGGATTARKAWHTAPAAGWTGRARRPRAPRGGGSGGYRGGGDFREAGEGGNERGGLARGRLSFLWPSVHVEG